MLLRSDPTLEKEKTHGDEEEEKAVEELDRT
jgi:hypothetical protein